MAGWLEISGTVMLALQSGQAIVVPAWAVSEEMFRPQAGHEKLNSLMARPVDLRLQHILREILIQAGMLVRRCLMIVTLPPHAHGLTASGKILPTGPGQSVHSAFRSFPENIF
jgi:hypothetical protein